MRFFAASLLGFGVLALAGSPAVAASKTASVKIINDTDWRLDQLHFAPSDSDDWGPDQLGKGVLTKGQTFTLTNIPCDTYDVKVVDEDGDECVVEQVDVCKGAYEWHLTSKDLLKCQAQ
jgi:hypothetical protein